jgi:hypothetical protein
MKHWSQAGFWALFWGKPFFAHHRLPLADGYLSGLNEKRL